MLLPLSLQLTAQDYRSKGHKFSVELGRTFGISTTDIAYGYRINPHFMLGGGIGFGAVWSQKIPLDVRRSNMYQQLYANARYNVLNRENSPFAELRAGATILMQSGLAGQHIDLTLGMNFGQVGVAAGYLMIWMYDPEELGERENYNYPAYGFPMIRLSWNFMK